MKFFASLLITILVIGILIASFGAILLAPEIIDFIENEQNEPVSLEVQNQVNEKVYKEISLNVRASELPILEDLLAQQYFGESSLEKIDGEIYDYVYRITSAKEEVLIRIFLIPDPIDEEELTLNIQSILGNVSENYGVYIIDLKRGQTIGINEEKLMPPGSISKVPIGLLTMRDIDMGVLTLETEAPLTEDAIVAPSNILGPWEVGIPFLIADYLHFLIIDSDNTSIRHLENILGGYHITNERTRKELDVEWFFRDPHDATAKDVARVFSGIYFGEYLSKEQNEYFLDLLKNTSWILQDGIPVGVPEPYKYQIAHKTGQISTVPGYAWADVGIIYGPKTDYVLCILNEKIAIEDARWKVQQISALVWETLQG